MGVGSGGRGRTPSWIFIHGTDIVDRGLIVLFFDLFLPFFDLFSVGPPWKRLKEIFFGLFPLVPPWEFFC